MATKQKAPPKQLRITLKHQEEYEIPEGGKYEDRIVTVEPPLGFANAYEPHTKAYAPREKTQDEWAYGGGYGCAPRGYDVDENGKYWVERSSWELKKTVDPKAPRQRDDYELITTNTIVPDELQPRIIDNVPMEGFIVQCSIARGGRYNNKLWRILDPRGFELEISCATFEELIMGGVIDKGLIVGPCIWRTGKILERV